MISVFINHTRDDIRAFLNKKKLAYKNIENPDSVILEDLAKQNNIFENQNNYLIFEYPNNKDEASILSSDFLINSPHNFYFECLCAKTSLPKKAQDFVVQKTEEKNSAKNSKNKDATNIFLLSEAFFSGDTKKTWLAFQRLKNISSPEELHGTYLWAIKTLSMARDSGAKKTLSPFVLNKISPSLIKLDKDTLNTYYKQVLFLSIDAHLGKIDFEKGLEKLILQMPK